MAAKKLENFHKDRIFQMLAMRMKPSTITRELKDEYDVHVSVSNICYYRKQYRPEVEAERERLRSDVMAIPFVAKHERLFLRSMLIQDLEASLWREQNITDKDGNIKTDGQGRPIALRKVGKHGEINRILDSIKEEMEPFEVDLNLDPMKVIEDELAGKSDEEVRDLALAEWQKYLPPGMILNPNRG